MTITDEQRRAGGHYTPEEADAYRRTWGEHPSTYTPTSGAAEIQLRATLAHGARHARCYPGVDGQWRCLAPRPGSDCGTIREDITP